MVTTSVAVDLGSRSYDIHVGSGLLPRVDALVRPPTGARRVALVTQEPVASLYAAEVDHALDRLGLEVVRLDVPAGEAAKSLATVADMYDELARHGFGRSDMVLALGGGVVGDVAGFVAATWNRGIALVQVPTTLVAQVDAAIGGKTAINLAHGKNLVGSFHQPRAVVSDVATLASLPARELTSGLGEVIKYGLLGAPDLLDLLETRLDDVRRAEPRVLEELVARCSSIKAATVSADEREAGARAHLNLGHTYGHALEVATGYETFLHGEAVAVGLRVALLVGEAMGLTPGDLVRRVEALLARAGLPTAAPRVERDTLWTAMGLDKKAGSEGVRFVLIGQDGHPTLAVPPRTVVDGAIDIVEEAA